MVINNKVCTGILLSAMVAYSCTDDTYDLNKDIDTSVTLAEQGLTIPVSSVEPITLATIMELDKYDDISVVTDSAIAADKKKFVRMEAGNYYMEAKSSKSTDSKIKVKGVKFQPKNAKSNASKQLNFEAYQGDYKQAAIIDLYTSIEMMSDEVTPEVRELNWVEADMPIHIDLKYTGTDLPSEIILQHGLKMEFSEYIHLKSNAEFEVDPKQDNVATLKKDITLYDKETKRLTLRGYKVDANKKVSDGDLGLYSLGHFKLTPRIDFEGKAVIDGKKFESIMSKVKMRIDAVMSLEDEITIKRANGTFAPDDNYKVSPVKITSLPDFLNDDDTELKIADPRVTFILTNQDKEIDDLDINIKKMNVTPWLKEAELKENSVVMQNLQAMEKGEKVAKIYVDNESGNITPSLTQLLNKVPDELRFDVGETELKGTLTLNHDYDVAIDYSLVAPLSLLEGSKVRYHKDLTGFAKEVEQLDFTGTTVDIKVNCTNTIPMDMVLPTDEVQVLDKNGNVMPGYTIDVKNAQVKAGTEKKPNKCSFTVKLSCQGKANETIDPFDGLRLVFKAVTPKEGVGEKLTTGQTLSLDEIYVSVSGGLTIKL